MTLLTDVAVDLAAGVEPLLLGVGQGGSGGGDARLAWPFDARQHAGGAPAEIAAGCRKRRQRGGLARQSDRSRSTASTGRRGGTLERIRAPWTGPSARAGRARSIRDRRRASASGVPRHGRVEDSALRAAQHRRALPLA